MSIDASLPDVDQLSSEIDKEIEISEEDPFNSLDNKKKQIKILGTQNINLILKNLMRLLMQKNWKVKKSF